MKQFIKYVLATITGIVILSLLLFFLSVISLISMTSKSSVNIEKNSVLEINLSGVLSERSEDNPLEFLTGSSATNSLSLENILKAIKKAKEEDKIKGIYIQGGALSGATPAMLEEIREALVDFKTSKKFILAYGDTYTEGSYYLASVADSVILNPVGMVEWSGLASKTMYMKDFMDKIGVKVEVFKVGTYKSAVEPYLLSEMSDANREQITVFSNEIWSQMKSAVSKSRKISVDKLNSLADSMLLFSEPQQYLNEKIVDRLAYSDEVPTIIGNMMDVDKDDYHTIDVNSLASCVSSEPKGTSGNIIAVYYAYGTIVDEASSGFSTEHEIVSSTVVDDLHSLANDDDVKAVVFRVNSGGGSAYASEQIWHAIEQLKEKKPVVVSMGGLAASGGYYISSGANYIFAEPTTLTGSIGIFGMFPIAKELINDKLGLHFSTVKTNEMSDFGDFSRDMRDIEKSRLQGYVNRGYELFTMRCADGRGISQDSIKVIGEGRVWTGEHALSLGLVDKLGNLDAAISKAKELAKVDEYTPISYPGESSFFDKLLKNASPDTYADKKVAEIMGEYYDTFATLKKLNPKGNIQAEIPYKLQFNL